MNKVGTQKIETKRLVLRRFMIEDAEEMYNNWASDPEVTRYLTWPVHADIEATRSLLARWISQYEDGSYFNWAMEYKETGSVIGNISVVDLYEDTEAADIGYCMSRAYWGQELMPEALRAVMTYLFDVAGLNRIAACHDVNNPKSGRVMDKAGMRREGILRAAGKNNQGIFDEVWHATIRGDREKLSDPKTDLQDIECPVEETEAIRAHYNADPKKEWDRLKNKHPYEKYITVHMMDRYIRPNSTILDIGGGPGHYSVHYARQGHDVTLLDLSEENVRFAKKKARQYGVRITARRGDALDLSGFPDAAFDMVFLMGPLYHLMEEENRLQAIREAKRVLRPGGFLFSSFILMFGGVIYGLRELQETILSPREQPLFEVAANDGSLAFEAFTYSYLTTVHDAKKLLASVPGLRTETVFGQEGILAPYRNILRQSSAKIRQGWYDYALRFCEKEDYLTHSEHLMIISEKLF